MLGECRKTERGFALVNFRDAYDQECSLQESSSVVESVWLGLNEGKAHVLKVHAEKLGLELPHGDIFGWMPYPIPEDVQISTRMHLNREQVEGLVERLQQWLKTGEFEENQ